ncbi:MAG: hypothetical protein ACJ73S_10965 [Mycobacteriales bacterium]
MNDILRRALEEDAADTPDPVATLAGIHRGIRRAAVRRRLTVAGAGVLVVAAAAGVPALAPRHSGTSTLGPAATPGGGYDPMRVPLRIGYIPPGWSPLVSVDKSIATAVSVTLSSPAKFQAVVVSLSQVDPAHPTAPPLPAGTKPPDNQITRDLDPYHRLTVYGSDPSVDHATLVRIADGVNPHASTRVTFPFRLRYVPTKAGKPGSVMVELARDPAATGGVAWQVHLTLDPEPLRRPGDDGTLEIEASSDTSGKPNGKVEQTTFGGHRAGVFTGGNWLEVILYDAIPNHQVLLKVPRKGPISRAELERVAAGIRPVADPDNLSTWTDPLR